MSQYLIDEINGTANIDIRHHTDVVGANGDERLEALILRDITTGTTEFVSAAALFVMIGAEPHTNWLPANIQRDSRGFLLTGSDLRRDNLPDDWALQRPPLPLETSLPGGFAAGMSVSAPSSASPQLSAKARSPPQTLINNCRSQTNRLSETGPRYGDHALKAGCGSSPVVGRGEPGGIDPAPANGEDRDHEADPASGEMALGQQVSELLGSHPECDHKRQVVQRLQRCRGPVLFVPIAA
jgi:hypothetical protein